MEPRAFGADHFEAGSHGAEAEVYVGEIAEGESGVEGADFLENGSLDEHGVAGEEMVFGVSEAVISGDIRCEIREVEEVSGGKRRGDLILGEAIDVLRCAPDDAEGFVEAGDLGEGSDVVGGDGHVIAEEEDGAAFGAGEAVGAAPGVIAALFESNDGDGGGDLFSELLKQAGDLVLGIGIVVNEDIFDFEFLAELLECEVEAGKAVGRPDASVASWNDDGKHDCV